VGNFLSRKKVLGGLVAGGVLTVGLAVPAVAFAEGDTPAPAASPSASSSADGGAAERGGERRGRLAERLAAELGVPQEQVEAALTKIWEERRADWKDRDRADWKDRDRADWKDRNRAGWRGRADRPSAEDREAWLTSRLNRAVSDGRLTQEQADAILAAVKAGVLPGWGGFGHGHGDGPGARTGK